VQGADAAAGAASLAEGAQAVAAVAESGGTLPKVMQGFATVSKLAMTAGTAIGLIDMAKELIDTDTERYYNNASMRFVDVLTSAINASVTWPEGVSQFELVDVRLNNSMQFLYQTKGNGNA